MGDPASRCAGKAGLDRVRAVVRSGRSLKAGRAKKEDHSADSPIAQIEDGFASYLRSLRNLRILPLIGR